MMVKIEKNVLWVQSNGQKCLKQSLGGAAATLPPSPSWHPCE